ncbi:hypothetical protein GQ457_06G044160 [Hibiscus cannabinus]
MADPKVGFSYRQGGSRSIQTHFYGIRMIVSEKQSDNGVEDGEAIDLRLYMSASTIKGHWSGGVQGGDDGLLEKTSRTLGWWSCMAETIIGRRQQTSRSLGKEIDKALRMVALHGWNGRNGHRTTMVEAADPGRRLEFERVLLSGIQRGR